MKPVRLPSAMNMPCSHHFEESCGRTANPTATVTTKPATAAAASRNLRVISRYGTKISGTSLIPAATPVSAPFHQRRRPDAVWSGRSRSHMIAAISTRLIWPR